MSCWHLTMEIGLQPTSSPTTALADGAVQMASLRAAISYGWPSWIHVGSQGCNVYMTGSMICSMYNNNCLRRDEIWIWWWVWPVWSINHTYGFIVASCTGTYCAEFVVFFYFLTCPQLLHKLVTKEAFKKMKAIHSLSTSFVCFLSLRPTSLGLRQVHLPSADGPHAVRVAGITCISSALVRSDWKFRQKLNSNYSVSIWQWQLIFLFF